MVNLITIIEDLNPAQQQFLLDILISVQEQRHITPKQAGLVGCSIEFFPVIEIKRLFSKNRESLRAFERLLGLAGIPETGFINLKSVIGIVMEEEIERRCEIKNQKTLFDFADENIDD